MNTATATMAATASQTGAIDVRDQKVARINTPAVLDATKLTFLEASAVDGTFRPVLNYVGVEQSLVVGSGESQSIEIPWDMLAGARFIKIRQGDKTTPVVAAAERTFTIVLVGGF